MTLKKYCQLKIQFPMNLVRSLIERFFCSGNCDHRSLLIRMAWEHTCTLNTHYEEINLIIRYIYLYWKKDKIPLAQIPQFTPKKIVLCLFNDSRKSVEIHNIDFFAMCSQISANISHSIVFVKFLSSCKKRPLYLVSQYRRARASNAANWNTITSTCIIY